MPNDLNYPKKHQFPEKACLREQQFEPPLMKSTIFPQDVSNLFLGKEETWMGLRHLKKLTKSCGHETVRAKEEG